MWCLCEKREASYRFLLSYHKSGGSSGNRVGNRSSLRYALVLEWYRE